MLHTLGRVGHGRCAGKARRVSPQTVGRPLVTQLKERRVNRVCWVLNHYCESSWEWCCCCCCCSRYSTSLWRSSSILPSSCRSFSISRHCRRGHALKSVHFCSHLGCSLSLVSSHGRNGAVGVKLALCASA